MTWPNLLSALRLGLIPIFVIVLMEQRPVAALVVFSVAGLTDLLDGFLARYLNQQSTLGAYLDPMADKLMMTIAFVILAIPNLHPGWTIPVWMTVFVIARDVLIVLIALILYLALGFSRFAPTRLSKWTTALQISAIVGVLLSGVVPAFIPLAQALAGAMIVATVTSGIEYGYRFVYRAGDLPRDVTPEDNAPDDGVPEGHD